MKNEPQTWAETKIPPTTQTQSASTVHPVYGDFREFDRRPDWEQAGPESPVLIPMKK